MKESKYGISLEKYAELFVKSSDAGEDEDIYREIIEGEGIKMRDWFKAKKEWEDKIKDPDDKGKTNAKFISLYESMLEKQYFERVPCSLETYTKIQCELSFGTDSADITKPAKVEKVLEKNGLNSVDWDICNSFWTVRVGLPKYRNEFSKLIQKYKQKGKHTNFNRLAN